MEILELLYQNKIGAVGAITLCILGVGISWGLWHHVIFTAVVLIVDFILMRKDKELIYYIEICSLVMFMIGATINLLQ